MKFDSRSGNRRSRSQNTHNYAPAIVESLETRALLAAPQIVSPVGTIADSTPVITWEAVDNATTYDLWVSDVETRERLVFQQGLTTTSFTVPDTSELSLGRIRIWARANFANGTTTGWGAASDVVLQVLPTITGPVNAAKPATPLKLDSTLPTITWNSPPGARSFEIFFSNQTERTSTTYTVPNLTPLLDGSGNTIPDGNGDVVREEIRSFELPDDLTMGQYRVFMRTTDDAGRVSGWTSAYSFEVAPEVTITRPSGPSFQNPPLLEWEAVPGATHYEVWVSRKGAANEATPLYNAKYLTTTSFQIPTALANGDYVFWVRARRLHQVTEVAISDTPTSGTYRLNLTTYGTRTTTVRTNPIAFNATAAEVQAAIRAVAGFESVTVTSGGTTPNLTYVVQIPQLPSQVRVTVSSSLVSGRVTATTTISPEVVGLWSSRSDFSTIQAPVISGPVGVSTNNPEIRTVTDVRPTIEWTAIDQAARYELWVDRTASSSTYLRANVASNSYTFSSDIPAGNYWVWVRAVSTTGRFTPWSAPYKFTATGGAPVITSPGNSDFVLALPTITWAPVATAVSYEIHIAWLNTDFDYIQRTGITTNSFSVEDPLNTGSYRVWVRAIQADGTVLNWSAPVTFRVADAEAMDESEFQLASLLTPQLTDLIEREVSNIADAPNAEPAVVDTNESFSNVDEVRPPAVSGAELTSEFAVEANADPSLIEKLAEACLTEEWWMTAEKA